MQWAVALLDELGKMSTLELNERRKTLWKNRQQPLSNIPGLRAAIVFQQNESEFLFTCSRDVSCLAVLLSRGSTPVDGGVLKM